MRRFARQNLMNRIGCDEARCGGRCNASPLHGVPAITHRALDSLIISLIGSDKPNCIGHG